MDRRQLPAVVFLTMSTMCVAARPVHAAAASFGHGAGSGWPGAGYQICRSWENHDKIVAEVINRGLNPGARHVIPRSRPFSSWGWPDEPAPA
jgi:hypothetical protein